MTQEKPGRRPRRSKENIEAELFLAADSIITRVGFTGLSVTQLLKEAKADPPVFYNRFKDINDFIDKYVRVYDYWLNDSVELKEKELNPIENAQNILSKLIDSLLENTSMQKLLAWELNEDSTITRRTAQNRDNNSAHLIEYFENEFKNCDANFHVSIAVLVGGIYYLIMHRQIATFNRVNFNSPEGIEALKKNISIIIEKTFYNYDKKQPYKDVEQHIIKIAKELLRNNVEMSIIENSTGLSKDIILSLTKV